MLDALDTCDDIFSMERLYYRLFLLQIPGGSRSQSSIVCGVVCTKNVTNKRMRQHILNPKILLLRASIEYQRVENKFSELEPQILQVPVVASVSFSMLL